MSSPALGGDDARATRVLGADGTAAGFDNDHGTVRAVIWQNC